MTRDEPNRWLRTTLRSTLWLAGTVVFLLCGWNQWWAVVPFLIGLTVAVALLASLVFVVPRVLIPLRPEKKRSGLAPKSAITAFALVKYPMVATLIWWVVGQWDSRSVIAFAAGFICLQAVIGLRAVGGMCSDAVSQTGRA